MTLHIHVYRADEQPATRFVTRLWPGKSFMTKQPKHRLLQCMKCKKRHLAKNMIVHVYFDELRFFCKRGSNCRP